MYFNGFTRKKGKSCNAGLYLTMSKLERYAIKKLEVIMGKKSRKSNDEGKNQRLYSRYKIGLKNIYIEHDGQQYPIIDFSYGGVALLGGGSLPDECECSLIFMKYKAFIHLKKGIFTEKTSRLHD